MPTSKTAHSPRTFGAVLGLLPFIATAAAVLRPIQSYDLWWHLATGRLMFQEGRIPSQDPFSFTRGGTPWLDHEWLFQILSFGLYQHGGWRILLAADLALAIGTYFLIVLWMRKEGVGAAAACCLLALSLAGARFRFDPRPEMVSLCLIVFLCFLLDRSRQPLCASWAWALPPLFLIWANIHPAALLGAALTILWLGGEWVQARLRRDPQAGDRKRNLLCLLSPLLILCNPWGWRLLQVPLKLRGIITSGHAPNLEWAPPAYRDFPLFYFAAVLAVLVVVAGFRNLDLPATLVALATGALAFQQLRNIGFFFVLLPLALARPVASLREDKYLPGSGGRLLRASVLGVVSLLFLRGSLIDGGRGYLSTVAPAKAVDFLESRGLGNRLFNDVKFGGYLIWRRYPEHRVFIDGRNEVYDPLLAEIFASLRGWESWESLLRRYRIDAALLRRGQMQAVSYPPSIPGSPERKEMRAFSAAYFQSSRWALAYWDDQALIFVRREDPAAAPLLPAEYRFNPDDLPHLLAQAGGSERDRRAILEELKRKLREDPACESARHLTRLIQSVRAGQAP